MAGRNLSVLRVLLGHVHKVMKAPHTREQRLSGCVGFSVEIEPAVCCFQVRSISLNVRKNVSLNTLSQDVLLKEFSTISWGPHTNLTSLQTDIRMRSMWTYTNTYKLKAVRFSILDGIGHISHGLNGGNSQRWTRSHRLDAPYRQNLKTLQTFLLRRCLCVLYWFLVCNLQYWPDC